MKFSDKVAVLSAAASMAAQQASGHSIFTTLFVNEVSQGDGTCVRMNPSPEHCTDPVPSLQDDDMACGIGGGKPVAFTCPAPAGGKLTFEWRLWANKEQPGVIDKSHMGPCSVYAKQVDNMDSSSAAGDGWIKLWHEGYDKGSKKWCTEKLIDNNGLLSINLPVGLPAGNWLFRPELLALQNVGDANDPQFYAGCAQVFVESDVKGSLNVPDKYKVSIPGHVRPGHPSVTFDVWNPKFPYTMPGPEPFPVPAPSGNSRSTVQRQTTGLVPVDAVGKNANWAGFEVPAYSTEDGCWKAVEDCWSQCEKCYDTAPVTGSANCQVFEEKCTELNSGCEAGNFRGPPNPGHKLNSADPSPPDYFPPAVNGRQQISDNGSSNNNKNAGGGGSNVEEGVEDVQPAPPAASAGGPPVVTVTTTVTARVRRARATGSA